MVSEPVIDVENVSYVYDRRPVIEDVSVSIDHKEFFSIIGPNGGGKTTLLRLILGLISTNRGRISVCGLPPKQGSRFAGYVPQNIHIDPSFPMTVRDIVATGLTTGRSFFPGYSRSQRQQVEQTLEQVQLTPFASSRFGELSGGQQKRCLIARALISDPRILILDEPTSHLDPEIEEKMFELLHILNETRTILLVSHDLNFVSRYVKRVLCLNKTAVCHETRALNETITRSLYRQNVKLVEHESHR